MSFAVTSVPANVSCIQVNVQTLNFFNFPGDLIASQNFTPTAGSSFTGAVPLGSFTQGNVFVSASAYAAACSDISGTTPTWVVEPLLVPITPGVYDVTTLNFRENFGVQTKGNFAPSVVAVTLSGTAIGLLLADATVRMVGAVPQPTGLTGVTQLAIGPDHACALKDDGSLWCWGNNGFGQLGDGTFSASGSTPVQVTGFDGAVVRVAAGIFMTCASTLTSTYCWGDNRDGAVGNGDISGTPQNHPNLVLTQGSAALSTTQNHTCAVANDGGRVWCWGDNTFGQIGDDTTTPRFSPVLANLVTGTASVAVGAAHTCAVHTSGKMFCWGSNAEFDLGLGDTTDRHTPAEVTSFGSEVAEVVAGGQHTCARTVSGDVSCVGANFNGEIGDGTGLTAQSPSLILHNVKQLSGQDNSNCALQADDSVSCWGDNASGNLGDGTFTDQFEPVQIQL